MKENDVESVGDVWLRGTICAHYFIPAKFWCSNFCEVITNLLKTKGYVYKENGKIKGFVTIREKDNYIEELYVDLPFKGKGIGTALWEFIKEKYQGPFTLSVYKLNTDAIKFYKKCGFTIIKEYQESKTGQQKLAMRWEKESTKNK